MNEQKMDHPQHQAVDPLGKFKAEMHAHVEVLRINMNELTEASKQRVMHQDPYGLAIISHKISEYQLAEAVFLRRLREVECIVKTRK